MRAIISGIELYLTSRRCLRRAVSSIGEELLRCVDVKWQRIRRLLVAKPANSCADVLSALTGKCSPSVRRALNIAIGYQVVTANNIGLREG